VREWDDLRSSGDDTILNLEVDGKRRCITITRAAVEAYLKLSPAEATRMSTAARSEFVRTNFPNVFSAVRRKLREQPTTNRMTLDAGDL
jgi:hypothetical protein